MMLPLSFSRGTAEFTVKKAALRLVWVTFSKMASSVEPVGVRPEMPALAKTMSSFPKSLGQRCEEPLAIFRNRNVSAVATRVGPKFCDRLIQRLLVATGNGDL